MKRFPFLKSFRLRVFLLILLSGLVLVNVMRYGMVSNLYGRLIESQTMDMTEQVRICANSMKNYDFFRDASSEAINVQLAQLSRIYEGRILVMDRGFSVIADTYDISLGKIMIGEEVIRAYRSETVVSNHDKGTRYIEVAIPVTENDVQTGETEVLGVILASASTDEIRRNMSDIQRRGWIIEIVLVVLLIGAAALSASLSVRPFERVTKAIAGVVSFEEDVPLVSDYKETTEIVEAFQKLRQRLKVLDDSRQEFVSNVSHELKTPIASIKVLADSLNMQEGAPLEMYRDFMKDISAEVDRENEIITDLLELVRMEKGASGMHVENVNVNELLEQITKRLGPLARKSEVDLILESHRPVTADMDAVKMTQAITNIIENGIKYNKHPGWVRIVLDADHKYMTLTISDSGTGIPETEIGHIFERFYRGDKSHSKEISGTGLGLAITRKTILLHRGSIDVKSVLGEGTSFIVKIPLSHIRETGESA
ncbi:MAG: HAMP domain-containing histidine kinase [Lachnospiraceae bacterium]|nr:HAMP domain-containing histidine kinase [Lachnospiraceae bacterium]